MTVYGYLRVSTDKQDCENQKIGVEALARTRGFSIENWIVDDGVSGTKEPEKRQLGKLLKKIKSGDVIICSELSRLGRKLFMVISILEHCMKIGAKVLTVKDGYELGDNVQSKVLAFAFGLVAELEREMISKRTKEALAAKKARGEKLGRAFGSKNKIHKYDGFSLEKFERDYQKTYSLKYCLGKQNLSISYFYGESFNETLRAKTKEIIEKHNKDKPVVIYCVNSKTFQKNVLKAFGDTQIKPIIRLSDFKVYKSMRSLWYDNFSKELNPTVYNLKKLAECIENGDEFHGKFFEFKDFYDGVLIG